MTNTAGHYWYRPAKYNVHELGFSIPILERNDVELFCEDTVIHEVAHFVDRIVNGNTGHNARFYNIMRELGNSNPTRCHTLVTPPKKAGTTFTYRCECCGAIIELGKIRHNKVYGTPLFYTHKKCGRPQGKLVYIGH